MGNSAPRVCRDDDEDAAPTGATKSWYSKSVEVGERGVVTVKVVMTRKEAERLAARLKEQRTRGRKARMDELKNVLRAGTAAGGDGCAAARPVRSKDLLVHTLSPIQER
uniref:Uncharacterized protein n=1 Tax=Leersia perrieri TaxID=77586 RepID=A0A0D9V469_9ORYZ